MTINKKYNLNTFHNTIYINVLDELNDIFKMSIF